MTHAAARNNQSASHNKSRKRINKFTPSQLKSNPHDQSKRPQHAQRNTKVSLILHRYAKAYQYNPNKQRARSQRSGISSTLNDHTRTRFASCHTLGTTESPLQKYKQKATHYQTKRSQELSFKVAKPLQDSLSR